MKESLHVSMPDHVKRQLRELAGHDSSMATVINNAILSELKGFYTALKVAKVNGAGARRDKVKRIYNRLRSEGYTVDQALEAIDASYNKGNI